MSLRKGPPLELYLEDVVRLRKPHPCGSTDWTVVRLGADIGLRCTGCGRRVLLPRRELERRLKTFLTRGPDHALSNADQETDVEAAVTSGAGSRQLPSA